MFSFKKGLVCVLTADAVRSVLFLSCAFTLYPFRPLILLPVCHCLLPVSSPLCFLVLAMCSSVYPCLVLLFCVPVSPPLICSQLLVCLLSCFVSPVLLIPLVVPLLFPCPLVVLGPFTCVFLSVSPFWYLSRVFLVFRAGSEVLVWWERCCVLYSCILAHIPSLTYFCVLMFFALPVLGLLSWGVFGILSFCLLIFCAFCK